LDTDPFPPTVARGHNLPGIQNFTVEQSGLVIELEVACKSLILQLLLLFLFSDGCEKLLYDFGMKTFPGMKRE